MLAAVVVLGSAACSGGVSHASGVDDGTAVPPPQVVVQPTAGDTGSTTVPAATVASTTSPSTAPSSTSASPSPSTTAATSTTAVAAPPPVDPLPAVAALEQVRFGFEPVAEFEWPVGMASRPGDPGLYVIGQLGEVWRIVDGQVQPDLVLDLRQSTSVTQAASSERGLLGIAFSPVDGRMVVDYTDTDGNSRIASWVVTDGRADPASEWQILTADQPGLGHNGGGLAFAPNGDLYIGFGDGGGSNGADARDMTNFMGTIVRVTPRTDGPGYDIPADNPFIGQDGVLPEIYAFGMRNPWRLSYDDPTGDVWFGDVGNDTIEEVDRIPAGESGQDFGWFHLEGTRINRGDPPPGAVPPVFEWGRDKGVAAIGGHVYRGTALPGLRGSYVFGDLTGQMWFHGADGTVEHDTDLAGLVAFGEDTAGELYLLSIYGDVVRLVPG